MAKKKQFYLYIFLSFTLQKLKNQFPKSCLKFSKDCSEKVLKHLLKN